MSAQDLQKTQYQGLTIIAFPPSMLSLFAETSDGHVATPHTSADAMVATGADAALDGPMFDKCTPGEPYAAQACGHVLYRHFDLTSHLDIPSSFPNRGVTISVLQDGTAQAGVGDAVPTGAAVAVQLYPELVANGAVVATRDDSPSMRAALAIMSDGKLAMITSTPMLMSEFSRKLVGAGAVYAGYTDGGGSTALETAGQYTGSSEHRRVLTWLLAKARQNTVLKTVSDTVTKSPATAAIAAAVGVGAFTAAWYAWSKRSR